MPILNIVTYPPGLVGVNPSVAYIDTNDTLATVLTTGYLNKAVQQGYTFNEEMMCCVSTRTAPNATSIQVAWLEISKSGRNWSLVTPQGGGVASVSGTANRITSSGGDNPVIDISAAYVGQSSITTLGTINTGVWQGTAIDLSTYASNILSPTHGGTGINNASNTLTLAGNLATSGAFATTLTATAATNVTLPTSGTLTNQAQVQSGVLMRGVDSGTPDNYVVTMTPPITAYTAGLLLSFSPLNSNTGNSTINVNGVGTINILLPGETILSPNDISIINGPVFLYCNGSSFTLLNPASGIVTGGILQSGVATLGLDNGTADDYMVTVGTNNFSAYTDNMTLSFIPLEGNATSSPQVSFNGLAAAPIRRSVGSAVSILDLSPTQLAVMTYSSPTNIFILRTPAN